MYSLLMDNMMSRDYKQYIEDVTDDIKTCIEPWNANRYSLLVLVSAGDTRMVWIGLV